MFDASPSFCPSLSVEEHDLRDARGGCDTCPENVPWMKMRISRIRPSVWGGMPS